jgi:RimJ/RimL family protein N-acetyltransferase
MSSRRTYGEATVFAPGGIGRDSNESERPPDCQGTLMPRVQQRPMLDQALGRISKCLVRMAGSTFVIQNHWMVTLETPRLILRRWREEDVAPMAAVNADPEVMRWIRDGSVRDEQQTRDGVQAWENEWESQGFGLFAVEIRSTGELAGFTGLSVPDFLPEVLPAVEVGWRLGRSHWGQGLATEAAAAAVRFGFEERGLERIVSIAQVGNDASERIMTKLGMHPVRETVNPTCGRRVRVFELSSDQYVTITR